MTQPHEDSIKDAFDRGVLSRTLAEHAEHLAKINGSTEKTAVALVSMTITLRDMAAKWEAVVKRLDAEAETRVALATALRDAEEQRLKQANRRWDIPMQRIAWFISGVSALVALYFALRHHG